MNTPLVPPAGAPAATAAGAAGLVSIASEIVRLPQELAARLLQAPRTVFLTGTVTGQSKDGALLVRSQFGEIAVKAGTTVPADRQVSLQIPPLSGRAADLAPPQLARNPIPASLLLTRPAAATPPGTAQPIGTPASSPITGQPAAPSAGAPSTTPGTIPSGPQPAPSPAAAPQGPAAVQPGAVSASPAGAPAPQGSATPSPVTPLGGGAGPAQTASTASPAPQAPATAAPATTAPASATTQGQPPPATPLLGRPALPGQVVTQTGTGAGPGIAATPTAANPAAPSAITPQPGPAPTPPGGAPAPVSSASPAAVPASQASARPGEAVVTTRPAPVLPAASGAPPDAALPIDSARRVPVLREAVAALSAADPALATQFVRSVVPQGNAQLAATLLFFLSATRGGDVRGWMGDRVAARLEDAGRADLLPRLSAELATPTRAAPEPAGAEWRSQTIPLYQDSDIGGLTLHVRPAGDEAGAGDGGEDAGRRFLIDMDLSRMGPLQLDGLMHDKRLDLTVRSLAAFPESMRQDMRTLFRDASDAVGLHGGLTFQIGDHDWVEVAAGRTGR